MLNGTLPGTTIRKGARQIEGRILIVDDQEMVRTMVADLLGGMNFDVITARDGNEAITKFKGTAEGRSPRRGPIDLVILDMILPEIDGRETYRRLKEIDPEVKVLFSTGYDLDDKVTEVLSDGAVGFIQKPYHIDKLVGMVREQISVG